MRWYTLRELEAATNKLREENVIGEGGYGIVYSGILSDKTKVAVKNKAPKTTPPSGTSSTPLLSSAEHRHHPRRISSCWCRWPT
ncbi:hypothetical protein ACFX13_012246 [Malus domestica]